MLSRFFSAFRLPPDGDFFVVSTQKDLRDGMATKLSGARVLRELKDSVPPGERIFPTALFIPEDPGDHANGSVDHHHGGDFAAVKDVVSDAQFHGTEDIDHPLVESLVTAAEENESTGAAELLHQGLAKRRPLRGQQNHLAGVRALRSNGLDALDHRFHLNQHPGTATVWTIVDLVVLGIGRPIA